MFNTHLAQCHAACRSFWLNYGPCAVSIERYYINYACRFRWRLSMCMATNLFLIKPTPIPLTVHPSQRTPAALELRLHSESDVSVCRSLLESARRHRLPRPPLELFAERHGAGNAAKYQRHCGAAPAGHCHCGGKQRPGARPPLACSTSPPHPPSACMLHAQAIAAHLHGTQLLRARAVDRRWRNIVNGLLTTIFISPRVWCSEPRARSQQLAHVFRGLRTVQVRQACRQGMSMRHTTVPACLRFMSWAALQSSIRPGRPSMPNNTLCTTKAQ